MRKFTLTFDKAQLRVFNGILGRLEEGEYTLVKEPTLEIVDRKECYVAEVQMDEISALTFRMGMRNLLMKMERTAEEQAEIDRIREEKTVRIRVNVTKE